MQKKQRSMDKKWHFQMNFSGWYEQNAVLPTYHKIPFEFWKCDLWNFATSISDILLPKVGNTD